MVNAQFELYKAKTLPVASDVADRNTSLAHFIGGARSVQGPVLNKARTEVSDAELDTQPVRSFLANPALLQERVALPGMVKAKSMDDSLPTPSAAAAEPPKSALRNYAARMEGPSSDKQQANTASLNRLRSSNLVKQRLEWSQSMEKPAEEKSHSPYKRVSVLGKFEVEGPRGPPTQAPVPIASPELPLHESPVISPAEASPASPSLHARGSLRAKAASRTGFDDFPEPSSPALTPSSPFARPKPASKPSMDSLRGVWDKPISPAPYNSTPASPSVSSRPLPQAPVNRVAMPGMVRQNSQPAPRDDPLPSSPAPRSFEPSSATASHGRESRFSATSSPTTASRPAPPPATDELPPSATRSSFMPAERPTSGSTLTWKKPKRQAPSSVDFGADKLAWSASTSSASASQDLKARLAELERDPLGIANSSSLSIDVLALDRGSLTTLGVKDRTTYYAQETIFVVLRSKGSDGLMTTRFVVWTGNEVDRRDEQRQGKVDGMSRQYKTEPTYAAQHGMEEAALGGLLGSLLVRQGSRSSFDPSNTCLYRVSEIGSGATLTSEVPLSATYVCSGFSYVLCLAGSITVWHGSFTNRTQRRAADDLAATLSGRAGKAEEEGASRTGLFWQVLGKEAPYAHSALWKLRKHLKTAPLVVASASNPLERLRTLGPDSLAVIDTGLEVYVVIPAGRRGDKADISHALKVAESMLLGSPRAIHCLVFPTLIPVDLQACYLGADLPLLNASYRPTQLSCYTIVEARVHLATKTFPRKDLADISALPVGVAPDDLA